MGHDRKMRMAIDLAYIFQMFRAKIAITWTIVFAENCLIALIPLLIGLSIDGLLAGRVSELGWMMAVLCGLCFLAVGRRIYDTRAYGTIRLHLGDELHQRCSSLHVSRRNARIDMSRELVDFLEHEAPQLIAALIQLSVSLTILTYFDMSLGLSSLLVLAGMLLVYACFHKRFYNVNRKLNEQREQQVDVLTRGERLGIFRHLRALRRHEVAISDTEAFVYGGIFLLQVGFIVFNLYQAAGLAGITAGRIFSIASYSWEFVEAALTLPIALQSWSRLSEITRRINSNGDLSLG